VFSTLSARKSDDQLATSHTTGVFVAGGGALYSLRSASIPIGTAADATTSVSFAAVTVVNVIVVVVVGGGGGGD
jgi:hypothetical protein